MSSSLLLFQLGPVQSFIAQADTLGELRAGSEMLSRLTKAALLSVIQADGGADVVFPDREENPELKGIPNRFMVYVTEGSAPALAEKAAEAAKAELQSMADETWQDLPVANDAALHAKYNAQIANFLKTTWAVLEKPSGNVGEDYQAIGKRMALRRNTREFDAWPETDDGCAKDYRSGQEDAIVDGLGALNLIKRHVAEKLTVPECGDYIAVIAMDGDKMGASLSAFKEKEEHRAFSRALGEFSNSVPSLLGEGALSVYAGGDDVLAVVKATDAVAIARKLSAAFAEALPGKTASAGIAVGHKTVPLQELVHAAHAAESAAKNTYGRNALALHIYKRSGEILKWGCNWDSKALEIYSVLTQLSAYRERLPITRFPYKLAALLRPYALDKIGEAGADDCLCDVILTETLHAVKQTEAIAKLCEPGGFKLQDEETKLRLDPEVLKSYLTSVKKRPMDFLNLFMAETFINRPREDREKWDDNKDQSEEAQ